MASHCVHHHWLRGFMQCDVTRPQWVNFRVISVCQPFPCPWYSLTILFKPPPRIYSVFLASVHWNTPLTNLGQNKMVVISQTKFSYIFSWVEIRFIQISQNSVTEGTLDNISVSVHGMAWGRLNDNVVLTHSASPGCNDWNEPDGVHENRIPLLATLIIT